MKTFEKHPPSGKKKENSSRRIALSVLEKIFYANGRTQHDLDLILSRSSLIAIDRAQVGEFVYGVLRRQYSLDRILARFVKKKNKRCYLPLLLGMYQLVFTDRIPDFAAIDETVACLPRSFDRGFVNAVLRNIAREKTTIRTEIEDHRELTIKYSCPPPLHDYLIRHFNRRIVEDILRKANEAKPYFLLINTRKISPGDFSSALNRLAIGHQCFPDYPRCLLITSPLSSFLDSDLNRCGLAMVMGFPSQKILSIIDPQNGDSILDACAGKGGKSIGCSILSPDGAFIEAVESNADQVQTCRQNIDRLGTTNVEINHADFLSYIPKRRPTKIIVDPPCSSLAEMAKYPELKLRFDPENLLIFQQRQLALLRHALHLAEPGTRIYYCVCSFTPEETTNVRDLFLDGADKVVLLRDYSGVDSLPIGETHSTEIPVPGYYLAIFQVSWGEKFLSH